MSANVQPVFRRGNRSLSISMELHALNRARLCDRLRTLWTTECVKSSEDIPNSLDDVFILLQGGTAVSHGGSDSEDVFRQESYFHWAFGALDPDCYGAINVANQRSILFIRQINESEAVYVGDPLSKANIAQRYSVDEVHYTSQILDFFSKRNPSLLLTLFGLNTDSGNHTASASFPGIERFKVNRNLLHHEISECRLIKTPMELEVIRYAVKASSAAHRYLMRNVKPGMYQFQAESLFLNYCYFVGGMRHVAYTCIAATGCDCAVLHYGHAGAPNGRLIKEGDMCLFDMGGEYYCYCSDITCSYPVSGRFTPDQRLIYEAVLAALWYSWVDFDVVFRGVFEFPDLHSSNQLNSTNMNRISPSGEIQRHTVGNRIEIDPGIPKLDVEQNVIEFVKIFGVLENLRPGVSWPKLHILSEKIILEHLLAGGLLQGRVEDMLESRLGAIFMPHGLGHLMGCDVHDVGGYNKGAPKRCSDPGLRNLRTARNVEANMVLTVEPGCYFIDRLLHQATMNPAQNKFLVPSILNRFKYFGGVRIEEDVLVTETGCEVLSEVPRTVADIEDWMSCEKTDYDRIL